MKTRTQRTQSPPDGRVSLRQLRWQVRDWGADAGPLWTTKVFNHSDDAYAAARWWRQGGEGVKCAKVYERVIRAGNVHITVHVVVVRESAQTRAARIQAFDAITQAPAAAGDDGLTDNRPFRARLVE